VTFTAEREFMSSQAPRSTDTRPETVTSARMLIPLIVLLVLGAVTLLGPALNRTASLLLGTLP
jgi:hypothetical protein